VRENTRWGRSFLEEPAACSGGGGSVCCCFGVACPLRKIRTWGKGEGLQ